jgi:hypothetical protein
MKRITALLLLVFTVFAVYGEGTGLVSAHKNLQIAMPRGIVSILKFWNGLE